MIDFGLLMSVLVVIAAAWVAERIWPLTTVPADRSFLDAALWPAVVGLAVGRLATLVLDDRGSLGSMRDMAVVRSGVEFWPGLAAAAAVAVVLARRSGTEGASRLADLAPITLVGYGAYEAACVFRDGCFGPLSSVGLRPDGLGTRMFPMGIVMGVAAVGVAGVARRMQTADRPPSEIVAFALASLGLVKAAGSIWLPHVGSGPTRQQAASIVVAVVGSLAYAVFVAATRPGQEPVGVAR